MTFLNIIFGTSSLVIITNLQRNFQKILNPFTLGNELAALRKLKIIENGLPLKKSGLPWHILLQKHSHLYTQTQKHRCITHIVKTRQLNPTSNKLNLT